MRSFAIEGSNPPIPALCAALLHVKRHNALHWKSTKYRQQQMSKRTNVHLTDIFHWLNYCSRDCMKLVKNIVIVPFAVIVLAEQRVYEIVQRLERGAKGCTGT